MSRESFKIKPVNKRLTMAIINFHEQGYTEDFFIKSESSLCSQNFPELPHTFYVQYMIDQVYDSLACGYKYIYAIETFCGAKGLLLVDGLHINKAIRY